MNYPRVTNMESPRTGRSIPNQFCIHTQDGVYFQSYSRTIAFQRSGSNIVVLDKNYWDYSRTTSKYRSIFLGESTKETRKKVESGAYILKDLND